MLNVKNTLALKLASTLTLRFKAGKAVHDLEKQFKAGITARINITIILLKQPCNMQMASHIPENGEG